MKRIFLAILICGVAFSARAEGVPQRAGQASADVVGATAGTAAEMGGAAADTGVAAGEVGAGAAVGIGEGVAADSAEIVGEGGEGLVDGFEDAGRALEGDK